MKRSLEKISLKGMDRQEWLKQRNLGLGGSDIGSIFGLDRYKPAIKLFHQKTGMWKIDGEEDNIAAYGGRSGEEYVYEYYWKFWDYKTNDVDQFLHNANNGLIQRKAKRVNSMIVNPKYPWLRANIDYEINKYEDKGNGILELKMPNSMHWNSYESGIPPGYLLQLQTYLIVCEYDYGEIFALKDGRYPEIFPYEMNDNIRDTILTRTKEFWDRVVEARRILADKSIHDEDKRLLIGELEPDPSQEEGKAYEDYMKDRFKEGAYDGSVPSSQDIEDARENYWMYHNIAKDNEKLKQHEKNKIQDFMDKNECNAIDMKDESMIKSDGKRLTIPKIKK